MIYSILLIAGSSSRLGLDTPKQFIEIHSHPLFYYPLKEFDDNSKVDEIIIVVDKDHLSYLEDFLTHNPLKKKFALICGGTTRQESVFEALKYIDSHTSTPKEDIVLIHDGARVLLMQSSIDKLINALPGYNGAVLALKSADSICYSENGETIEKSLNRNNYYRLQTPQAFYFNFIFKVHKIAIKNNTNAFTDDTSLAIINGGKIKLVEGEKFTFKLTTFDDLILIKKLLEE